MDSIKDIAEKVRNKYGDDGICNHCIYNINCIEGVRNYGSGPIFPPCADLEIEDYFDIDSIEGV